MKKISSPNIFISDSNIYITTRYREKERLIVGQKLIEMSILITILKWELYIYYFPPPSSLSLSFTSNVIFNTSKDYTM